MVSKYDFYIDDVLLPVAPSSMSVKIKSQNKTVNLINDGEVSVLKTPGLTEYSFEILLPAYKYPFAKYISGFRLPKYYLDKFEDLKNNKKSFAFIVTRELPDGKGLFDTSQVVTIEDYTIKEDSKNGFDMVVTLNLKQYRPFQTKECKVTIEKTVPKATTSTSRPTSSNAPKTGTTYTVKKGDSLWKIAKMFYGKGSKYTAIYNANKDKIKSNYVIYAGQVLTIPDATSTSTTKSSTQKKSSGTDKSKGGSKTNPPFAIVTKSYDVVKVNIKTWNEAYGYYMAMGGSGKGWKIVDKDQRVITL